MSDCPNCKKLQAELEALSVMRRKVASELVVFENNLFVELFVEECKKLTKPTIFQKQAKLFLEKLKKILMV